LVDAKNGYHIWSGSYQRELTDIFQLQDELARGIVQALRVELGVESVEPLVAEQTKSLEAYNWFMRGRALYDFANLQTNFQSISYFENAVEADPDYAMAWGYLSFAKGMSILWQSFDEASPAAITAYERALALDPEQSEALAIKAFFTQILDHDYETAGKLYQRAMASKGNANAMGIYASFLLLHINEIPQAIRLYTEAEKRDPLHAGYKANLAHILLVSGDAEAAYRKAREAVELNPQHLIALFTMVQAYTLAGNYTAAHEFLESLPTALQQDEFIRNSAALCYAAQGDYDKAREIYRDIVDNKVLSGVTMLSQLAFNLGEVEEAIDLMELGVEQKSWDQFWIRTFFHDEEAIREQPRYLALLKRIGLDDESVAALNSQMSFD
jgi:serine/threonine-protein kinase